jgi:uncharacterized protein
VARDPTIPESFDVYTVVVLRRPDDAPELAREDLDALQTAHLAYRADLARRGLLVANGPFGAQSDPSWRGMSIFSCGSNEAIRLSAGDPSVVAGRLTFEVMEWWVRAGSLAFPMADRPIGVRRSMPDA